MCTLYSSCSHEDWQQASKFWMLLQMTDVNKAIILRCPNLFWQMPHKKVQGVAECIQLQIQFNTSFNNPFISHRRGFFPICAIYICNYNTECVDDNECVCVLVCFPGHGLLPDAVGARGGDPVQAGAREEGHHQGNMVGEASGDYSAWYMETHTHSRVQLHMQCKADVGKATVTNGKHY